MAVFVAELSVKVEVIVGEGVREVVGVTDEGVTDRVLVT